MPHFYSASPAHGGAIDAPEYPVHEGKDQNKHNANYYVLKKKTHSLAGKGRTTEECLGAVGGGV